MSALTLALSRPKRRTLQRLFVALSTLGLLFLLLFSYFNARLSPVLFELSAQKASSLATYTVDSCLSDLLGQEGSLLKMSYDSRGRLSLLTCDTAAANRVRTKVSLAVNAALENEEYTALSVPLGSLFSSPLFAGHGPHVSARIVPLSTARVSLADSFTSAGINQTMFTLACEIEVEVSLISPFCRETRTLFFTCPITQIIIAGDVPQVYLGA